MIECNVCGYRLSPGTTSDPCPVCGSMDRKVFAIDIATACEVPQPILMVAHHFAPEWFEGRASLKLGARRPLSVLETETRSVGRSYSRCVAWNLT